MLGGHAVVREAHAEPTPTRWALGRTSAAGQHPHPAPAWGPHVRRQESPTPRDVRPARQATESHVPASPVRSPQPIHGHTSTPPHRVVRIRDTHRSTSEQARDGVTLSGPPSKAPCAPPPPLRTLARRRRVAAQHGHCHARRARGAGVRTARHAVVRIERACCTPHRPAACTRMRLPVSHRHDVVSCHSDSSLRERARHAPMHPLPVPLEYVPAGQAVRRDRPWRAPTAAARPASFGQTYRPTNRAAVRGHARTDAGRRGRLGWPDGVVARRARRACGVGRSRCKRIGRARCEHRLAHPESIGVRQSRPHAPHRPRETPPTAPVQATVVLVPLGLM